MGFSLHCILRFLMLLVCTQESESSQKIKHKNYETAVLGRNVTIFCNLTSLANVLQVTWQKIQGSLLQNIGTYSQKYGENILPPYVNRLHCKILEPDASFITIQGVTFEDEACYKCLFNTFPYGSHGEQTCLNILIVPELIITELNPVNGSEDLLNLHCSAVGKPAPGISIYPSQALVLTQEEYFTTNPNTTVTVTKIHNISLKTVRSLGLQQLVVSMTHPLRSEDKIVPLPVKQEGPECPFLNWRITAIVFAILFFTSCVISTVLCIYFWKKRSENMPVQSSTPTCTPRARETEDLMSHHHQTDINESKGTEVSRISHSFIKTPLASLCVSQPSRYKEDLQVDKDQCLAQPSSEELLPARLEQI